MTATLRVLTVDDEPLALRRLALGIAQIPGYELVAEADGCASGLRQIDTHRPDILIVDVRMRDGTGFDLIEGLSHDHVPAIIFATAYDSFAAQAFDTPAVDYVLKPIEVPRLREALERARARIASRSAAARIAELKANIAQLRASLHRPRTPPDNEFWIRGSHGTVHRVALRDVVRVTSEDDYIRLHVRGQSFLVRMSIKALERQLPPDTFVRVHRSTLVRRSVIRGVERSPAGVRVILDDGTTVASGRIYARTLAAVLAAERSA